jgi:hypothetical protein
MEICDWTRPSHRRGSTQSQQDIPALGERALRLDADQGHEASGAVRPGPVPNHGRREVAKAELRKLIAKGFQTW